MVVLIVLIFPLGGESLDETDEMKRGWSAIELEIQKNIFVYAWVN